MKKSRATSKKRRTSKTSDSVQDPALPSPGEGEEITPVSQETPQAGEGGERVEVEPNHHRAIEQAIQSVGVKPEDVSPDDIVLAAEYHAQGMDPTQAFQQAVIMNAKFDKEKRIAFAATWFDKEQQDAFVAAYEKLDIALNEGTRQFYKRSGDGGRATAITQLDAVIDFIEALMLGGGELTLPLQMLLYAVNDLNFGIVGPILKPQRSAGRPPSSSSRRVIQQHAVKTMQILMEIGVDYKSAAKAVAETLHRAGTVFAQKDDDWEAVAKWREQVEKSIKQSPYDVPAQLYHRDLEAWREQVAKMRSDGLDADGTPVDDRGICQRVLGHLALFVVQHGDDIDNVDPNFHGPIAIV